MYHTSDLLHASGEDNRASFVSGFPVHFHLLNVICDRRVVQIETTPLSGRATRGIHSETRFRYTPFC